MAIRSRMNNLLNTGWLSLINAVLCTAAVMANMHYQFFCRPVPWASIVLIAAFIPVIFYPLLRPHLGRWNGVVFFLFGIAACICVYCILFLWEWNFLALPVTFIRPVAILAYVPHFLLVQIILRLSVGADHQGFKGHFALAILLCLTYATAMATWFHRNIETVAYAYRCSPDAAQYIKPSYMTERMLGMHFKYHMSFCAYDGWRPPLHDPSIVVAAWLNWFLTGELHAEDEMTPCGSDPWEGFTPRDQYRPELEKQIVLYKLVFPQNKIRQDCSCAAGYSKRYMNDPILQ